MQYKTEQESFWAGPFGDDYLERNAGTEIIWASNARLFQEIIALAPDARSFLELGCNIGLNLQTLRTIDPTFNLMGYEINATAAATASARDIGKIFRGSVIDPLAEEAHADLVFTKGVLIHIAPDYLPTVYNTLVERAHKYILICEYYNPTPVEVSYRDHERRLYKRDFAGELIDQFGLKLKGYRFHYRRDEMMPQDDMTWFLLEK